MLRRSQNADCSSAHLLQSVITSFQVQFSSTEASKLSNQICMILQKSATVVHALSPYWKNLLAF